MAPRQASPSRASSASRTPRSIAPPEDAQAQHQAHASALALALQAATPAAVEEAIELTQATHAAPATAVARPDHRTVNDVGRIRAQAPADLDGTLAFVFSALRDDVARAHGPDGAAALDALVASQSAILQAHGVGDRDALCDVLDRVVAQDRLTGVAHGTLGSIGFNVASLAGGLAPTGRWAPASLVRHQLAKVPLLGAEYGTTIAMGDSMNWAATGKTMANAYYCRPPQDALPAELRSLNAHHGATLGHQLARAWMAGYGTVNAVRFAAIVGTSLAGRQDLAAPIDAGLGFVGNWAAGTYSRLAQNSDDAASGRAGIAFFLARADLGDCLAQLDRPTKDKLGGFVKQAAQHGATMVASLPEGARDTLASKLGWASHTSLAAGFAGVYSVNAAVASRIADPRAAPIVASLARFVTVEALWGAYGEWMGGLTARGNPPPRDPSDAA